MRRKNTRQSKSGFTLSVNSVKKLFIVARIFFTKPRYRYVLDYSFMKPQTALLFSLAIIVFACDSQEEPQNTPTPVADCSTVAATFSEANTIIQSSCANATSCHASGSTRGPGALTTYSQIFNARTSIRSAVASGDMPRNSTLTASQKATIICWIDNGAPNN